jgi:IS5 family transposase
LESDWTVKNDKPHYGLKEHASVDINHSFILATTLTPSSVHDTNLLQYCTAFSRHTKQSIEKVYADKGYAGLPNREFLAENKIADGIMRKNSTTATLTEYEIKRNKKISKVRYIACPRHIQRSESRIHNHIPVIFRDHTMRRKSKCYRVKTVFWNQSP